MLNEKEKQESSETVTISKKEYEQLLEDSKFLQALRDSGVDNWEGYSEAYRILAEDETNG